MTMLASMRNRLAALEESMPGIGEWWYSPNVITYTGGVNSKAFARVNFNDDLSKTVYAVLYAKIGDSLSSGAADGFFNCKKLAERFPLAYGANFALRDLGGTRKQKIAEKNLPGFSAVLANTNELFVGDADWFGSTTTKVSSGYAYFTTARKLGNNAEAALDIIPPYLAQNIIVRAL